MPDLELRSTATSNTTISRFHTSSYRNVGCTTCGPHRWKPRSRCPPGRKRRCARRSPDPTQRWSASVQLLVEPVAESTDRLSQHDGRGDRVAETPAAGSRAGGNDPGADGAQRDCTPDAETALPDLQRVAGLPPSPKYVGQSVITWYSRPPISPNGTAHTAMSSTVPFSPPARPSGGRTTRWRRRCRR